MKNKPKYKINAHNAIIGYIKNGIAGKGECSINIELTELASSIDTNTSNILLQYIPIKYIITTAIII